MSGLFHFQVQHEHFHLPSCLSVQRAEQEASISRSCSVAKKSRQNHFHLRHFNEFKILCFGEMRIKPASGNVTGIFRCPESGYWTYYQLSSTLPEMQLTLFTIPQYHFC